MSTSLRLAAFAAGVVVVFLLAFGAGRVIGPWSPEEPATNHSPTHEMTHGPDEATDQTPEEARDAD